MITKLKFKQGEKKDLPALSVGEPGFTTDTGELFVGKSDGNVKFYNKSEVDGLVNAYWDGKQDKLVAGDNITIDPDTNVISASGAGGGNSNEPDGVTIVLNEENKLKVSENLEIDGGFL